MNIGPSSALLAALLATGVCYVMYYGRVPAKLQVFGPVPERTASRLYGWSLAAVVVSGIVVLVSTPAPPFRQIICVQDVEIIAQYYGRITDDGHRSKTRDKPWMLIRDDDGETHRHRRGSCWVQP